MAYLGNFTSWICEEVGKLRSWGFGEFHIVVDKSHGSRMRDELQTLGLVAAAAAGRVVGSRGVRPYA